MNYASFTERHTLVCFCRVTPQPSRQDWSARLVAGDTARALLVHDAKAAITATNGLARANVGLLAARRSCASSTRGTRASVSVVRAKRGR